ncbi:MAG: PaaI family thioesterase [Euryarchaeota archaeon]|nr:PaaI family thioesterase [Euryarchaeota archaeon]
MDYISAIKEFGRDANPFFREMDIAIVSYEHGSATLSMLITPKLGNGAGWLTGGMYAALADEAMALALVSSSSLDERSTTISLSTQFIKGIREGIIFAKGTLIRKGRQIAFLEAIVTDESGLVLARCQGSFLIMPK